MRYGGIDIGTAQIGYAIVDEEENVIESGSFVTRTRTPFTDWDIMFSALLSVYSWARQWDVDVVGIEYPFVGPNPQVGIALGVVFGYLAALFTERAIVYKVSVLEAKQVLTGSGRATKKQMVESARELNPDVKTEHEADAIAVAISAIGMHEQWKHASTV